VPLRAGERLRITNTHGGQVVDTWALARADPAEYLSMEHTRTTLGTLVPAAGDHLYSSRRRPLLTLVEDTSPGAHDTLIAACDPERYRLLGAEGYHASCAENFRRALSGHGIDAPRLPAPLNLFMQVRWDERGRLDFLASPAQAGDYVTLEAVIDVTVVLSACPMDLNPINAGGPQDVALEVLRAE
ncbi:MAG: DUF1989 domain-containing protein, partial [Solirubrobacteraceae bacterium]